MSDRLAERAEMLVNRARKNLRHLRKWARREQVSCYRIYDRDIPEIPLAIDWYDGRLHVAQYERGEDDGDWVEPMALELAEALEVDADRVFVKTRRRQRGQAQYQPLGRSGDRFVVSEGGHRFWVNLADYLDTGLFLDHRPTRARVGAEAAGARFINLFCYTGAFTVYAAGGGARSSVSVDLSNTYLDWAHDNFELNGIDTGAHELVRADVLAMLADPPAGLGPFDLAVVDPPTFSNSKKMSRSFDVQRDHVELLRGTLALMAPGGVVYFSTNRRGFRLDADALDCAVEPLGETTIPPDFRNKRIHQCYRLRATAAGDAPARP